MKIAHILSSVRLKSYKCVTANYCTTVANFIFNWKSTYCSFLQKTYNTAKFEPHRGLALIPE